MKTFLFCVQLVAILFLLSSFLFGVGYGFNTNIVVGMLLIGLATAFISKIYNYF
jgi:hypothetical protein